MASEILHPKVWHVRDSQWFKSVARQLPPVNYITLHYLYFIVVLLVMSVVFWLCSDPWMSIEYTDALFLVVSAMTEAGLNTVNLSEMTTAQQVMLFCLIVIGSSIFVSIATVLSRKWVIESRFEHLIKMQKESRRMHRRERSAGRTSILSPEHGDKSEFQSRHSEPRDPISGAGNGGSAAAQQSNESPYLVESPAMVSDPDHISFLRYVPSPPPASPKAGARVLSFAGVGAHPLSTSHKASYANSSDGIYNRGRKKELDQKDEDYLDTTEYPNYLTSYTTGRNAQFFNLTREEREHLGGVEYRAIKLLGYVVPGYFIFWQATGCIGLAAYFAHNKANVTEANGINPWWLGIFNGASAFNNSGMSLLDANMIPFQTAVYPLMQMGIMILAGNTAYPIFLRFILWSMLKAIGLIYPSEEQCAEYKATLRFILKYPRRVYTHIFPAPATRWLLFMVFILNGIDWVAFELLNLHNPYIQKLPPGFRVLDGLFQALAVRAGGFYVIAIPNLRIGLQVLYVIMMYISAYPIVITMRHSNVYEERSLGIYAGDTSLSSPQDPEKEAGQSLLSKLGTKFHSAVNLPQRMGSTGKSITLRKRPPPSPFAKTKLKPTALATGTQFVKQQISGQLTHDLWLLILAIFAISCIEGTSFDRDPVTYSVFNICFEVVSGYGCVGISTGVADNAYSFSGGWHKASKLILVLVMLRGRHRGLPVALDRAVELPHGVLHGGLAEEEDWGVRRSLSRASVRKVGG
ncbi:cation transport protein-domain-containing protein [Bisporella sp. PMI_857]|nr:cation transport protein-domain-containing protein [Bisporella sp. PMI_857]